MYATVYVQQYKTTLRLNIYVYFENIQVQFDLIAFKEIKPQSIKHDVYLQQAKQN